MFNVGDGLRNRTCRTSMKTFGNGTGSGEQKLSSLVEEKCKPLRCLALSNTRVVLRLPARRVIGRAGIVGSVGLGFLQELPSQPKCQNRDSRTPQPYKQGLGFRV